MYFSEKQDYKEYMRMFECIAGYGLGTSIVSIFTRIGGGIYNKAADVSSDLVGKVIAGLDEDSPLNPGVIADHVGDNVGAIVGACGDFYGSLSESLCASLILCSLSSELVANNTSFYFFPFMIISIGSLVCLLVSLLFGTFLQPISIEGIDRNLKWQPIIAGLMLAPLFFLVSSYCLPELF